MHVETLMDPVKAIRTHKVNGLINLQDFKNMLTAVYHSAEFDPNMHSLWDVRQADFGGVTPQDIRSLADLVKANWVDKRQNKAAIVVSGLADYGITRMYEQVLGPAAMGKVRIFRNIKSAWDWIEGNANSNASSRTPQPDSGKNPAA